MFLIFSCTLKCKFFFYFLLYESSSPSDNIFARNYYTLDLKLFTCRFSNAKKCTNCGRALMQLDLTQLVSKFEKISLLRPMPYQEYVTAFIKAYYIPEINLECWIKDHPVSN